MHAAHIMEIYTICLKYGLIRPFKTILVHLSWQPKRALYLTKINYQNEANMSLKLFDQRELLIILNITIYLPGLMHACMCCLITIVWESK